MDEVTKRAARIMMTARTALVLESPFFGALALRLKVVPDPKCKTAWVDGVTLGYNPAFIAGLTHPQVVAIQAHEVMHCASGHPWRRDGRDNDRWNKACDRAINPIIRDAGFKLPEGVLYELDATHVGKSAEWIYGRLPEPPEDDGGKGEPQKGGQPSPGGAAGKGGDEADDEQEAPGGAGDEDGEGDQEGEGQGGGGEGPGDGTGSEDDTPGDELGEVRDSPADADEQAASEEDWQQAVAQAANAAKGRGSLPGALDRFAEMAAQPKVDWRSALRRFVQASAKADYSWRRPNKRYVARGLYLPSLMSEAMGKMVIAVDTSGSIDAVLLGQFGREIQAIVDEMQPEQVIVMYADARVAKVEVFERDEPFVLATKGIGGGGTAFGPVFDAVEQLDEPPACLVYLTDLDGSFPVRIPEVPTLWAATTKRTAPFGETVYTE